MHRLYLITDRTQTAGRPLSAVVADALEGGVRMLQLREKDLSSRDLFDLAMELRQLTKSYNAQLIINDRIDIALAVGADGVHLGVASIPVAVVRGIVGKDFLIGYSAHAVSEALEAEQDGADFITFGPVFDTPSKRSYGQPLGLQTLSEAVKTLSIPVYALGGIKLSAMSRLLTTGCRGIALISAVMAADDPCRAAEELIVALEN